MGKDPKAESINFIAKAKIELEEALLQIEQLPAFDTDTISFAAHALNNYLTVSFATVDLIRITLKDHPDPQIHTWLKGLQHVSNLMTHTVSQLMNASASGKPQFIFDKVNFPLFVQRGCDYYQRIAERKQIRIAFNQEGDMPPVWADRVAAGAAMDNLLSNAVKYSESGTEIQVSVSADSVYGVCHIQDEGPGLSLDDQTRLFQKGVRLSAVPTGGERSTGYGLAVVKGLIDELDGKIVCQSELGRGSCFSIYLPLYREEQHGSGK